MGVQSHLRFVFSKGYTSGRFADIEYSIFVYEEEIPSLQQNNTAR